MRSNPTCQHTPTRGYQGTVSIHGSLGTGAFSNSPALYFSLTSPRTLSGPPPPVPGMVLGTPSPYPEPAEGSKVAFGRLLLLPVTKKGLLFGPEKQEKLETQIRASPVRPMSHRLFLHAMMPLHHGSTFNTTAAAFCHRNVRWISESDRLVCGTLGLQDVSVDHVLNNNVAKVVTADLTTDVRPFFSSVSCGRYRSEARS